LEEINPVYFYKPYFLEPLKGGSTAYALLQKVLCATNKAGIAKVVIRTRQHLAAVKCNGPLLVLELMRFEKELLSPSAIKVPSGKAPSAREQEMARHLIEQMTESWDPSRYRDDYRSALMKVIDKKVASGGKSLPAGHERAKRATNVVDLAAVLRESLAEAGGGRAHPKRSAQKPRRKVA
jgi:DNA end-binding protein Ku